MGGVNRSARHENSSRPTTPSTTNTKLQEKQTRPSKILTTMDHSSAGMHQPNAVFSTDDIQKLKSVLKKRFEEVSLADMVPGNNNQEIPRVLETEKKKESMSEYSTSVTTEDTKTIENNVQENTETITESVSNTNLVQDNTEKVKTLEKRKTVSSKVDSSTIKGVNFVKTIVKKTNIEIMNETRIGGNKDTTIVCGDDSPHRS